jgi:hypothetical protein
MRSTLRAGSSGAILLAVVTAFLITSCGSGSSSSSGKASGATGGTTASKQLFPDNFQGVCQGATQSQAKAYVQAATGHKVVYFETYTKDLLDQSTDLPGDWTVTFDPKGNVYATVDLVACAVRTSDTFVKECDGYQKDDKPTNNKVELHTAKYDVSVHEATTGKELAKTQMSGDSTDCPMFQSFDDDNQKVDSYSTPAKEDVVAFIKPFIQP